MFCKSVSGIRLSVRGLLSIFKQIFPRDKNFLAHLISVFAKARVARHNLYHKKYRTMYTLNSSIASISAWRNLLDLLRFFPASA
jgi:hypothetical protein